MNNFITKAKNSKIKPYWISLILQFTIILIITIVSSGKIGYWGVIISFLYWIFFIIAYTRVYDNLKSAVKTRFPKVYPFVFSDEPGFKNKYLNLDDWEYDSITGDMYEYDLNIKNTYIKLKELDFFKYFVFGATLLMMILTLVFKYKM